jgi:hypothetical protein
MSVLVRVDNLTYSVLGLQSPLRSVLLNDTAVSPTQTKFTIEVGPMQINLTYLNPIEPKDWVKQSIPFSYMTLTARSLDGTAHTVQVYTDINAEWQSAEVNWAPPANNSDAFYHSIGFNPNGFVYHSALYFATRSGDNVTYMIDKDGNARKLFQDIGTLDNQEIYTSSDNLSLVSFSISRDLGTIQSTQEPIIWVVGFIADPVLNFTDLSGAPPQQRSLYCMTQYSDEGSMIVDLLNDFSNASSRAQQLDAKILQDAAPISGMLGYLVSLATAQVYGSIQLTIPYDGYGYFTKSDAMAFMKNMAGLATANSVPNQVNAVVTLYSAFPAFMYLDPGLGGLFLEPLFQLQASPKYSNLYAAPDLGTDYPNVTISNSANSQGIENSGNMLIMAYAHARASGDDSLIMKYYSLLTSWADYLSNVTLFIHDQFSADNLMSNNQTNLAIKGIIAIEAMSKMSSIVKKASDENKFSVRTSRLYDA